MLSESNKTRTKNVFRLAMIVVVVFVSAIYFAVPNNVLALKLLMVPMFWFSLLGLKSLYKDPIEEQAVFSANVIEYHALFVLHFSAFLLIVCWVPELDVGQIIKGLVVAMLFGLPVSLFFHHRSQQMDSV